MQGFRKKQALHTNISKILRSSILRDMEPGSRLPAEQELAKRFGVSMVTIRNATQALEQIGLVKRVSGRGVYVRDARHSQCIALVFGEVAVHPQPLHFILRQSALLQVFLSRKGWQLSSFLRIREGYGTDGLGGLRGEMMGGRVGVLLWNDGAIPKELLNLASEFDVQVLDATDAFAIPDYPGMTEIAIRHLLKNGCRRIGLLAGSDKVMDVRRHFIDLLEGSGLEANEEWIQLTFRAHDQDAGANYIRRIWGAASQHPDGLVVLDDVLFRSAARCILELGVEVPAKLKIVTHSNTEDGFLNPFPAARLEISVENSAKASADTVLDFLSKKPVVRKVIPCRLVPESSSEPHGLCRLTSSHSKPQKRKKPPTSR